MFTGNNIKVKGDFVRRSVKCRLNAGRERPETREFKCPDLAGLCLGAPRKARHCRPNGFAGVCGRARSGRCAREALAL